METDFAPGTSEMTLTERLVISRLNSGDNWEFSALAVSQLWLFCFSDTWMHLTYADYYIDFWRPFYVDLEEDKGAFEIEIVVDYTFGHESKETIDQYEKVWKEKNDPPMMVFALDPRVESIEKPFVHAHIVDWKIKAFELGL